MQLELVVHSELNDFEVDDTTLREVLRFILEQYQSLNVPVPYNRALNINNVSTFSLSVCFVASAMIRETNRQSRGVDKPTDILSFPIHAPIFDGLLQLGDLIICPQFVGEKANTYEISETEMTYLLLSHGILHLLGFDHEEEDIEADLMEEFENHVTTLLTLTFGLEKTLWKYHTEL